MLEPLTVELAAPFEKYIVYSDGRVFSNKSGKFLTPQIINSGYLLVKLWEHNREHHCLMHRLVASCFVPNPNGYDVVNHIDGNRLNNDYRNLEWTTQRDNLFAAQKLGLIAGRSQCYYEIRNCITGEVQFLTNFKDAILTAGTNPGRYCINVKLREQLRNCANDCLEIPGTNWFICRRVDMPIV